MSAVLGVEQERGIKIASLEQERELKVLANKLRLDVELAVSELRRDAAQMKAEFAMLQTRLTEEVRVEYAGKLMALEKQIRDERGGEQSV
jgi:hypothetical protein